MMADDVIGAKDAVCLEDMPVMALAQSLKNRLRKEAKQLRTEGLLALESVLLSSMMEVRDILNQLRPAIHRLPVEILRQIFSLVPRQETSSSDALTLWQSPFLRRTDCVHLMSICRYWRQVVLDDFLIWNNVYNFNPPASLQGARHTNAILYLKSRPKGDLEAILLRDMAKLHELRWEHANKLPSTYLTTPAPLLQNLAISAGRQRVFNALTDDGKKLFDGHTPSLRRLALHFVRTLPPNNFAHLMQLFLHGCMEIDRVQFLTWLAASPEIEDITLSHVSFSSESDAPDPEMQPLHCLRRLVIKDMKEEGIAWLFAISALTPETAVLLDDVPLMAESEAAAIPHYPVTESVTRLAVWHTYSSTFMMATGSSAGLRQKSRDVPETPSIDSSIRLRFPLINVTEFWCISMSVSRVEMDMRLLLSEMPALSTLAVDEIDLPRLIQALSPSAQNGEYAAQAICPNLCVLHIIIWRHRDAQNILGSLDAVLSARKRAGCPLQRLILHSNPKDLMFRDPRASFSGIQSEWKRHREWTSLNLEMPEVCAQPAHRHWSPWSIF